VQAVAGIVGCAELLCVALSVPALLCFFMAADSRHAAGQQLQALQAAADSSSRNPRVQASKQHSSGRGMKQQQQGTAGTEPLRTLLMADAVQHWCLVGAAAVLAFSAALTKEIGITVIGTMLLYDLLLAPNIRQPALAVGSGSRQGMGQLQPAGARRKLLRMVLVAATAVVYVKMRSWVAVQQLVDIYRKVRKQGRGLPQRMSCWSIAAAKGQQS
jgi:hypothetical protein